MISDWEVDRVEDPNALTLSETLKQGCVDTAVLCGSLGKKYPDARVMGILLKDSRFKFICLFWN
jgi:hypothetical protein